MIFNSFKIQHALLTGLTKEVREKDVLLTLNMTITHNNQTVNRTFSEKIEINKFPEIENKILTRFKIDDFKQITNRTIICLASNFVLLSFCPNDKFNPILLHDDIEKNISVDSDPDILNSTFDDEYKINLYIYKQSVLKNKNKTSIDNKVSSIIDTILLENKLQNTLEVKSSGSVHKI